MADPSFVDDLSTAINALATDFSGLNLNSFDPGAFANFLGFNPESLTTPAPGAPVTPAPQFFLDTQTGQIVTAAQAFQLDPAAFQDAQNAFLRDQGLTTDTSATPPA